MASEPAKLGDLLDYDFGRSWRVYLGENAWFRTTNEHHARRLSVELSAAREMREVLRTIQYLCELILSDGSPSELPAKKVAANVLELLKDSP